VLPTFRTWVLTLCGLVHALSLVAVAGAANDPGLSPMRPLPGPTSRPRGDGPGLFVDPIKGADENDGSLTGPWRTLQHALRKLKPGDTLYLRGGTYYEHVALTESGTPEAPITIRSFPGETAILDGGLREFHDSPETSWEPLAGGAEGEYVSTKTYPGADGRVVPFHFIAGAWEPMVGVEDDRPLALGHFADSMVPLHGYRFLSDLRSDNEFWVKGHKVGRGEGADVYCGPGLWYDRDTGRIHARFAHHRLPGLGDRAYHGETDPRKLRLIVALGFGQEVMRINGIRHVSIEDLVFRGATGSPMIHVYSSEHIRLDHVTVFGGSPALLVNAVQHLEVMHSAFRGMAAPWSSRAHMKYRGTACYTVTFQNNQPENDHAEFAYCEFTDGHDFAHLQHSRNLKLHHSLIENFNDDGIEVGPKLRDHSIYAYQNLIRGVLIPISGHEIRKDESPIDHDPGSGVYLSRNVFDLRPGVYRAPPRAEDPPGSAYLNEEGHLASDHGGPVWPVIRFYHNTVVRRAPTFRGYFLMGLGAQGLRDTERDVYNNVFVQFEGAPGVNFGGMKQPAALREGGNILWVVKEGPGFQEEDVFAHFRRSALFEMSKGVHAPGWTTEDLFIDPRLTTVPEEWVKALDLRPLPQSASIDAGTSIPVEWPDPLREADRGKPDIGVLPAGAELWRIGVDGRYSCFGEPAAK
jgi:hypothetical protein